MELSKRLSMVASMVKKGSVTVDVGCDHGYVSIWLVREKICPHMLAMDVNAGPLERAREHVEQAGLASYIQLRRSDGLKEMRITESGPEADTLLAAGIGGRLATRILRESAGKLALMRAVVLQPQSEPWMVRQTLRELGYHITEERMVREEGKFYTAIRAENGRKRPELMREPSVVSDLTWKQWREAADRFGPLLILGRNPLLSDCLEECLEKHALIRERIRKEDAGEKGRLRLAGLEEEDRLIESVLSFLRTPVFSEESIHRERGVPVRNEEPPAAAEGEEL